MDTKSKILNAVAELLLSEGHQKVSVRRVAAQAGVNHGLVHHYFGSKEKMLAAAVGYVGDRKFAQFMTEAAKEGGDLGETMQRLLLEDSEFSRLLTEFFVLGAQYPSLREALGETARTRRDNLVEIMGLTLEEATTFQMAIIGAQVIKTILGTEYVQPAAPVLRQMFGLNAKPNRQRLGQLLDQAAAQNPNGDSQ